jgi:NADPH2:quinone reductase
VRAWIPTHRPTDPLTLGDLADPTPAPDEAVVAVEAFSINRGETFILAENRPGWRPGKDVAGVVVVAAPNGSGPPAGARVVGHPTQGGWAERVAVPTDALASLPAAVDTATAATLPLAGLTALRLLRTAGSLSGLRVLLTGASGGVGHAVVELAAAQGARITAVVAHPERGARLLELGAEAIVTDVEKVDGPVDVAFESVGGDTLPAVWARLAPKGQVFWMGQAGGAGPTLDFFDYRGGTEATLRRFSYIDSDHSITDDLATLVRLVAGGHLHPEIGWRSDWSRTPAALAELLGRRLRGNAVLTISRSPGGRSVGAADDAEDLGEFRSAR